MECYWVYIYICVRYDLPFAATRGFHSGQLNRNQLTGGLNSEMGFTMVSVGEK